MHGVEARVHLAHVAWLADMPECPRRLGEDTIYGNDDFNEGLGKTSNMNAVKARVLVSLLEVGWLADLPECAQR